MNWRNLFVVHWYLMILHVSCASFPKQNKLTSGLNLNTVNRIEGSYNLTHCSTRPTKDSSSVWNFSNPDMGRYPNLFDEINNGLFVKSFRMDSTKTYSFYIDIVSHRKLKIYYYQKESAIKQNTMRYRLKDDGYLYLRYRNFKIIGLPYLLGGIKLKRSRMTLNSDHNLIFETSEVTSGGMILFFVFQPLFKSKYEKIYRRIE